MLRWNHSGEPSVVLSDAQRQSIALLNAIIERARDAAPDDRADDPHRGGPFGSEGVSRPAPPPEPQPEADWGRALGHYLADLPDAALAEVVGLYRYGRGDEASTPAMEPLML